MWKVSGKIFFKIHFAQIYHPDNGSFYCEHIIWGYSGQCFWIKQNIFQCPQILYYIHFQTAGTQNSIILFQSLAVIVNQLSCYNFTYMWYLKRIDLIQSLFPFYGSYRHHRRDDWKKDGSQFFPCVTLLYNTTTLDLKTNWCLSLKKRELRKTSSDSCKIWNGRWVPNMYWNRSVKLKNYEMAWFKLQTQLSLWEWCRPSPVFSPQQCFLLSSLFSVRKDLLPDEMVLHHTSSLLTSVVIPSMSYKQKKVTAWTCSS